LTTSSGLSGRETETPAEFIKVYRFQTWDREAGRYVWATGMGTPEAIRKVKGEADLASALVVARGQVDANGLYHHPITPVAAAVKVEAHEPSYRGLN